MGGGWRERVGYIFQKHTPSPDKTNHKHFWPRTSIYLFPTPFPVSARVYPTLPMLCKNCSSPEHLYKNCRHPVTSMGLIVVRPTVHDALDDDDDADKVRNRDRMEVFMVCRRHTLGYFDFVRGNYEFPDTAIQVTYVVKMLSQITQTERDQLLMWNFDMIWDDLWNQNRSSLHKYAHEKTRSQSLFERLQNSVVPGNADEMTWLQWMFALCASEASTEWPWKEPEWGFPKGRRNQNEDDLSCALREFLEETRWFVSSDELQPWVRPDLGPLEETFLGSNLRAYTHRYFVAVVPYHESVTYSMDAVSDATEISLSQWIPLSQCCTRVRSYNLERKQVIRQLQEMLQIRLSS